MLKQLHDNFRDGQLDLHTEIKTICRRMEQMSLLEQMIRHLENDKLSTSEFLVLKSDIMDNYLTKSSFKQLQEDRIKDRA